MGDHGKKCFLLPNFYFQMERSTQGAFRQKAHGDGFLFLAGVLEHFLLAVSLSGLEEASVYLEKQGGVRDALSAKFIEFEKCEPPCSQFLKVNAPYRSLNALFIIRCKISMFKLDLPLFSVVTGEAVKR